jgi:hypothetical protein
MIAKWGATSARLAAIGLSFYSVVGLVTGETDGGMHALNEGARWWSRTG